MKIKELTLEFVNNNFYNIGEVIYRKDGKKCKNNKNSYNYYYIRFKNNTCVHNILWILYNQEEIPEGYVIDHVDGNTTNNSKENLRLATRSQNCYNSKISRNNKLGIKCIRIKNNKGYLFYYCTIGKQYKTYSKSFPYTSEGLESAKEWITNKRKELHGDFANNG